MSGRTDGARQSTPSSTLTERLGQPFWIAVAGTVLSLFMAATTDSFATGDNVFNLSRNFAFVAIAALGANRSHPDRGNRPFRSAR